MNMLKFQTDLLKMFFKYPDKIRLIWDSDSEDNYFITHPSGHFAIRIPKAKVFIDLSQFENKRSDTFKNFFTEESYDECYDSKELVVDDKRTLHVFKNKRINAPIYIDDKYLKFFTGTYIFKYDNRHNMLQLYEDGKCVGAIMAAVCNKK